MIRYFIADNIHNLYKSQEYVAQSEDDMFPAIGELIFIEDTPCRVADICYSTRFKANNSKYIKITLIDITLIKVEPPYYEMSTV